MAFQVVRGPGPGLVLSLEHAESGQHAPAELTLYCTAVVFSQAPGCPVPLPGYGQCCLLVPCPSGDVFYHVRAVTSVYVCAAACKHTHTFLFACSRRRPCAVHGVLQSSVLSRWARSPQDVRGFLLCPPAPPTSLSG